MTLTERRLRADAERNRRRILRAAAAVIAREGVDACVEAIAREAGVGMGTLYRRFARKDDLVRAVIAERADQALEDLARAADASDPWAALTDSVHALAARFAEDQGFLDAVARGGERTALLQVRARLLAALDPVLARARDAGAVRADVTVTDLIPLASIVTRVPASAREADPRIWERFLAVVLDGLRPGCASALPRGALPYEL
jgi:AcrR family transcriptional regulator